MGIEAHADRVGDGTALAAELETAFGPADAAVIRELPGGNANTALLVAWDGAEYVVRIPPTSTPARRCWPSRADGSSMGRCRFGGEAD